MLSQILESDPDIAVAGVARDGAEAVELTKQLRPNLVTMDIHMPKLDGVSATEEIMAYVPTPILVVSSSVRADQTGPAFDAMAAGALDVLKKPEPRDWSELDRLGSDLISKVKILARVRVVTHLKGRLKEIGAKVRAPAAPVVTVGRQVLAIGSSTGGPSALQSVLAGLPEAFEPAVLVAQHIAEGFIPGLVDWLAGQCALPVSQACDGEPVVGGRILIAPTVGHMCVGSGHVEIVKPKPQDLYRPSCNVLFESVARVYRGHAVGVILTGMGSDGAQGLKALHDAGGYTIAQDEETSVIYGMPKAAVELGAVDVVAPIDRIAEEVVAAVGVGVG